MTHEELLTISQAQERLRESSLPCSRTKIYSLGKQGKLKLKRFGRTVLVTGQSLRDLIDDVIKEATP